ncbi:NADH:flavin oxidoreductase/NADH oxidase [bacterium LRH843]|nr:NADH:flavin oxidoreductase/NADH oxidase [bacterium LRH843]
MTNLMTPFKYKSLELKNRVVMAPMCQYSAVEGVPNEWHYIHYTSRAVGGTGLIMIEMTNVDPEGRITDGCLGIWSDDHLEAYKKIIDKCHEHGAKVGIQIAHAGRKAQDAAVLVSSVDKPFDSTFNIPKEMDEEDIDHMIEKFRLAVRRAVKAGVDTIELHGAHGYLIHQFHSPYINDRADEYGKDLTKFGVEVVKAVKEEMPMDMPLIMRVSGREYVIGGYDVDYIIKVCKVYEAAGVDIFHVSSGGEASYKESGMTPRGIPGSEKGYQVPLAEKIRKELNCPVIAVGKLEDVQYANSVVEEGKSDLVAVGRGMLVNPYWTLQAANLLNDKELVPGQYLSAFKFSIEANTTK